MLVLVVVLYTFFFVDLEDACACRPEDRGDAVIEGGCMQGVLHKDGGTEGEQGKVGASKWDGRGSVENAGRSKSIIKDQSRR